MVPTVFQITATALISVAGLSAGEFVVTYKDTSGTNSHAYALYSNGGGLSVGAQTVSGSETFSADTSALAGGSFLIAFSDGANREGTYIVLDSGGTVTAGPQIFSTKRCANILSSILTTGEYLFVYKDTTDTQNEYLIYEGAALGVLAGPAVLGDADTSNVSSAALDAGKLVITYSDGGNSNYGTFIVTQYSGGTLTSVADETVFEWATTSYTSVVDLSAVSAGQFLVAYSDGGDGNKGTAVVDDGREYFTIEKVSDKEARLHNDTSEILELILTIYQ